MQKMEAKVSGILENILGLLALEGSFEVVEGPGIDKELLFIWLLIKKVTNWDYRTIASMAGVSHPTLIRANNLFMRKGIYQKVFVLFTLS